MPQPTPVASIPSVRIRVDPRGPYIVKGAAIVTTRTPVLDRAGEAIDWTAGEDRLASATCALCRCGHSGKKPFCDGTHAQVGFDAPCTADRAPGATRRKVYRGAGFVMTDDETLCAGYAYCDRHGGVWRTIAKSDDPAVRDEVQRQVTNCPSGRLQFIVEGAHEATEATHPPTIATIPDGALWVLGPVVIETADGAYEMRNRQLLCRCGASANKPFCDGSHRKAGFKAP